VKEKNVFVLLLCILGLPMLASEAVPLSGTTAESMHVVLMKLERSYWLHASLGDSPHKNYWDNRLPESEPPSQVHVSNAAQLLTRDYHATRLYLIYNKEISIDMAYQVFSWWQRACTDSVEIVPTLLLSMYDKNQTPVFTEEELSNLCKFFRGKINPKHCAVYDVYPNRIQPGDLTVLTRYYPDGLIRVGLQPGEELTPPFKSAVEDTWSGFCHGIRNEQDWLQPGFGAESLRKWILERNNTTTPIAWDLIVVAWDYSVTQRGEFPGYDDADKNMPLPAGRNLMAVKEILSLARPSSLAGFSSDLFILNENSRSAQHDGGDGAFYRTLREGKQYNGYYAEAFREILAVYRDLAKGRTLEEGH